MKLYRYMKRQELSEFLQRGSVNRKSVNVNNNNNNDDRYCFVPANQEVVIDYDTNQKMNFDPVHFNEVVPGGNYELLVEFEVDDNIVNNEYGTKENIVNIDNQPYYNEWGGSNSWFGEENRIHLDEYYVNSEYSKDHFKLGKVWKREDIYDLDKYRETKDGEWERIPFYEMLESVELSKDELEALKTTFEYKKTHKLFLISPNYDEEHLYPDIEHNLSWTYGIINQDALLDDGRRFGNRDRFWSDAFYNTDKKDYIKKSLFSFNGYTPSNYYYSPIISMMENVDDNIMNTFEIIDNRELYKDKKYVVDLDTVMEILREEISKVNKNFDCNIIDNKTGNISEQIKQANKYHIKPDGTVGVCRASKRPCPYGENGENHFISKDNAQRYADYINEQ